MAQPKPIFKKSGIAPQLKVHEKFGRFNSEVRIVLQNYTRNNEYKNQFAFRKRVLDQRLRCRDELINPRYQLIIPLKPIHQFRELFLVNNDPKRNTPTIKSTMFHNSLPRGILKNG